MSLPHRPLSSNLRHTSIGTSNASTGQSPLLVARLNEKKAELENLKQLRDLSGGLAAQMQALEDKLSTLSNGTEGSQTCPARIISFSDKYSLYSGGGSPFKLAQCYASHQHGIEYDYFASTK